MTKQKAHQIYDQYWGAVSRGPVCKTDELPDMRPLLEQAIIAAIEEEREACVQISDESALAYQIAQSNETDETPFLAVHCWHCRKAEAKAIATAIRARSKSEPSKGNLSMTITERVQAIIDMAPGFSLYGMNDQIEAIIRNAIEEEREACAKILDQHPDEISRTYSERYRQAYADIVARCARMIRARS
jgi:hypothetical protein